MRLHGDNEVRTTHPRRQRETHISLFLSLTPQRPPNQANSPMERQTHRFVSGRILECDVSSAWGGGVCRASNCSVTGSLIGRGLVCPWPIHRPLPLPDRTDAPPCPKIAAVCEWPLVGHLPHDRRWLCPHPAPTRGGQSGTLLAEIGSFSLSLSLCLRQILICKGAPKAERTRSGGGGPRSPDRRLQSADASTGPSSLV